MQKKGEITEFNPVLICDLWAAIERMEDYDEKFIRFENHLTEMHVKNPCGSLCNFRDNG